MKKVVYKANREPSGAAGRGCKRYFIKLRTAYGRYFVSIKLKAKVKVTKKANTRLFWKSSNQKFATVKNGKVKAKKNAKGKKVKITAMATDGSGKKKSVTIKIR